MAHLEGQTSTTDPLTAALNKALGGEPAHVHAATHKALADPDVIKALAGRVLGNPLMVAKIEKAASDMARDLVEKKREEVDAAVSDMKSRVDRVEAAARVSQPAIRPQAEPNPMGARYRQLARETDDRQLRAGYSQLADEHDTRSVN